MVYHGTWARARRFRAGASSITTHGAFRRQPIDRAFACELDQVPGRLGFGLYAAARERTQALSQFAGALGYVALEHCRAAPVQLVFYRVNDRRVIVAEIVNAIAGEEIQYALPFAGEQLGPNATFIMNIHLQQFQQARPLRVHSIRILLFGARFPDIRIQQSCICGTTDIVEFISPGRGRPRDPCE